MSERGEPPGGPNRGGADGEDEFGAVVFDATFVRAAALHEPSARERLHHGKRPHRQRRLLGVRLRTLRLVLSGLIVLSVIAGASFVGAEHAAMPESRIGVDPAVLQRVSLAPPPGRVPHAPAADPFAGSPAAGWEHGASGIGIVAGHATTHFDPTQVGQGLDLVREFVVATQLDPAVLRGGRPWAALPLLRRTQREQLGAALVAPRDDDVGAPTGWLTRFDPAEVRLSDLPARVAGTLTVVEHAREDLVVVADVVFVYAVAPLDGSAWTRVVVHRVWDFHMDAIALREGELRVRRVSTTVAPQRCDVDTSVWLRPTLAGGPAADAPPPADRGDAYGPIPVTGCGRSAGPL